MKEGRWGEPMVRMLMSSIFLSFQGRFQGKCLHWSLPRFLVCPFSLLCCVIQAAIMARFLSLTAVLVALVASLPYLLEFLTRREYPVPTPGSAVVVTGKLEAGLQLRQVTPAM